MKVEMTEQEVKLVLVGHVANAFGLDPKVHHIDVQRDEHGGYVLNVVSRKIEHRPVVVG